MAVPQEFSYRYKIEGTQSSIKKLSEGFFIDKIKSKIAEISSVQKLEAEEKKIKFLYPERSNVVFKNEIEIKKLGDTVFIDGKLKREMTGFGKCLVCSTLGLVGYWIASEAEKVQPDNLKNELNLKFDEIAQELIAGGKLKRRK